MKPVVLNTTFDATIRRCVLSRMPASWDWRQIKAQLWQESNLRPDAVSRAGAQGLAQFMFPTFADVRVKCGYGPDASPFNPEIAIDCACFYMASIWRSWTAPRPDRDRWYLTLASYNAGFGSIEDAQARANEATDYETIIAQLPAITGASNAAETTQYVRLIQGYYDDLCAAGA